MTADITREQLIELVHGCDDPTTLDHGDLEWLRYLLEQCKKPGVFEAILGDGYDDDADIALTMLERVGELYARLAERTGYGAAICSDEVAAAFDRRISEAQEYAARQCIAIGDALAGRRDAPSGKRVDARLDPPGRGDASASPRGGGFIAASTGTIPGASARPRFR